MPLACFGQMDSLEYRLRSHIRTSLRTFYILKIVLLPRNPWQHIAYLKLNQPKIKATKFPQKIVCGNATDTALYISANGNAAETRNATSFCSYVFPPSGNVTETWTIRFPQDFRNTETPYFTLCRKERNWKPSTGTQHKPGFLVAHKRATRFAIIPSSASRLMYTPQVCRESTTLW